MVMANNFELSLFTLSWGQISKKGWNTKILEMLTSILEPLNNCYRNLCFIKLRFVLNIKQLLNINFYWMRSYFRYANAILSVLSRNILHVFTDLFNKHLQSTAILHNIGCGNIHELS